MTIRNLTLGACLLFTCTALATHYKVKHGDTVASVAEKLGVSQKALLHANDLGSRHRLKPGSVLAVPSSSKSSGHTASIHPSFRSYVVRNGDCDWTVAHRFNLTVPQLHALNPNTDLSTLTVGSKIKVPGHGGSSVAVAEHRAVHAGGMYTVHEDDNDWIIAKNVGTTPKILRQLNPNINWSAVQPGQKIHIPGSGAIASRIPTIHSRHAVISRDDVVLREGPSTDSDKIVTVDAGVKVTVIDHQGSWYKLQFPKGTEAWVRGDNLKPVTVAAVVVHHHLSHVAVRQTMSHHERNARLAMLEHRERLARLQAHSRNVSTREAARHEARRIRAERMALHMPNTDGNDLLADARGMLGTPYVYGAMSRGATDCSGFVGQVYRRHGIRLPRTSVEQSHVGQTVSKRDLEKGDLVFFRTRGSGRVSHVGMYVGNGNFIHASSGGGHVQISSLSDSYYSRRFAGAKRVAHSHSSHHSSASHESKPEVTKSKDEDGDN